MDLTTPVQLPEAPFSVDANEVMLFVGSCFASNIGERCLRDGFRATVNPYGTMYNPVSIRHTVQRWLTEQPQYQPRLAVFTLGTTHVYRLKSSGEIVDNCEKRPQRLFQEEELSIGQCVDELQRAVELLQGRSSGLHVVVTVSPIRYRKYGYHTSKLCKARLLLAADELERRMPGVVCYFPAYEIMDDELRSYRFYAPDMLHPSEQAADYIYQRFSEMLFSEQARQFIAEWTPLRKALEHRPLHPESVEYAEFKSKTMQKISALSKKYGIVPTLRGYFLDQ